MHAVPIMRITLLLCLLAVPSVFSVHAAGPERATHAMFKGVELYSWKDSATGAWRFSLLAGTNRNKTTQEITAPSRMIADVPRLKQRLALLAKGEQVFWSSSPDQEKFAFPPAATVAGIVKFATAIEVKVAVVR